MKIKENKTRISLWLNNNRFAKIELNKLIITNGYSKHHHQCWNLYNFKNIDNCLELLHIYLLGRSINISLKEKEKEYIKHLYKLL